MKTNLRISGAIMALTCMTAPAVSEAQETIASPVEKDVRISSVSDFVPSRLSKDGLYKLTFTDFDETSGVAKATSVDGELTTVAEINVTAEPECYNYFKPQISQAKVE